MSTIDTVWLGIAAGFGILACAWWMAMAGELFARKVKAREDLRARKAEARRRYEAAIAEERRLSGDDAA